MGKGRFEMDKLSSSEYFKAIVRTKNISAAAEELGISQPALSAFLKRQEAAIGHTLIDRSTVPVSLTEAGQVYLSYLDKMDILNHELSQELCDIDELKTGSLVIGGATFFNVTYLPAAVAEFNKLYPGIRIEIVDGKVPEIVAQANAGNIDVFTTAVKTDEDLFCYEEMFHEKLFLCIPEEWEINEKLPTTGPEGYAVLKPGDLKLLADSTFILLHEDQDIGHKMNGIFKEFNLHPANTLVAGQTLTTLELTLAGVGISLISESTLSTYSTNKKPRLYYIDSEFCSRTMYVAYPKMRYVSGATKEFIKALKKHNR